MPKTSPVIVMSPLEDGSFDILSVKMFYMVSKMSIVIEVLIMLSPSKTLFSLGNLSSFTIARRATESLEQSMIAKIRHSAN